jgi:tol-pal system protein YbgF
MRRAAYGFVLVSAFVAAPSGAALFRDDVARKGVQEQQKRIDGLSARYDELAARFSKLEEFVKASTAAATQPVFDLSNQLQVLREDLRSVRGQLEVLSNSIEANAKRQRDMYVDLDTRMRRIEQAAAAPAPPAAPATEAPGQPPAAGTAAPPAAGAAAPPATGAGTPPGPGAGASPAAASTVAVPVEEQRVYDAAQAHRRAGNYQAAITAFQGFVTQFPRSSLAHRAQYWIGDSYYNLRDFKNAITAQQKLISTYPDSTSIPDGMLNLASSQIELGQTAAARKTMDSLLARYPTSDAAEKAKRRIASLR